MTVGQMQNLASHHFAPVALMTAIYIRKINWLTESPFITALIGALLPVIGILGFGASFAGYSAASGSLGR